MPTPAFHRIVVLSAGLVALAGAARADVNKFVTTGAHLEAGTADTIPLLVKGSFNTRSDKLRAKIKCEKGCPIRGRMKATCHLGDGFYFNCTGAIRTKCQVEGVLYQHGFEGTYTCGARTGQFTYGNP